jgi:hypothetical protein
MHRFDRGRSVGLFLGGGLHVVRRSRRRSRRQSITMPCVLRHAAIPSCVRPPARSLLGIRTLFRLLSNLVTHCDPPFFSGPPRQH